MNKLESVDQLKNLYEQTSTYVLFKNSLTCPVSQEAYREMEKFVQAHPDVPLYYLNVQELREGSNDVAETFNIKHESPQAFVIADGNVTWNASHWNVTKKNVEKALAE
ncbi:bacillithiol system redox-active protein YtxJ [Paenalkalicoccus suaedae]|uniref:Bacillithiol system redox-active protein YtxJ n=1 Tax=Paenalkalicoccus suaedae TaxID=2592382 RepID=A0A859FFF2_9BACI|nr:bacillithiol system redox-active protein YtxJ [Paenalkalicoccus suaedae]QKS72083.1 bacillithiol system redox-active protein YtxJ [Paenalkalicoccus suaedae]